MWTASEFRSNALSLVGLPYILGAEATYPNRPTALDCSELIEWLFAGNGTPIGDLAASQYDKTVAVGAGRERVGDMVFLKNNTARWNGIGHVAVLTAKLTDGDWEIVEARGRAYGVVKTTLSYWKTRTYYTGVRRFPSFALMAEATAYSVTKPISSVIVLGSTGDNVRRWQKYLHSWYSYGAQVAVDGIYGPISQRATKTFQKNVGIKQDGEVGPITLREARKRGFTG